MSAAPSHARAGHELEQAGHAARTDSSGCIFVDSPTDAAHAIANDAISAASLHWEPAPSPSWPDSTLLSALAVEVP